MLDLTKIRAITLDLDDTLWPIWPTIERAEKALQHWLLGHAPRTSALLADPAARLALRHEVMAAQPDMHHQLSAQRLALIRLALERSDENTALAAPAFEVFFDERNRVTLFDDALQSLAFSGGGHKTVAADDQPLVHTRGQQMEICNGLCAQMLRGVGQHLRGCGRQGLR